MGVARVLLAIVVGISLLGYGWTLHQNQQADVQEAVTVVGTVESTDVEHRGSSGSANDPGGGHYEVVVRYTYTYEGEEYTSESVYPGAEKQFSLEENAREVADHFSAGQTATVYVNQENPSRSFLIEEKTSELPFAAMGVGALVAVGGLFSFGKTYGSGESSD